MSGALDPRAVARGVPLVQDRLLIELVNDLHTADDLSRARGHEGFFARLLSRTTGHMRKRDQAIGENTISAQRRTLEWVNSLSGRMAVTDLVVAEVSEELAEAKTRIDSIESALAWTADGVQQLATTLTKLATETGRYLSDHERRILGLESQRKMDEAIRRWQHPRPDPGLPWLVGAMLLAREVAGGPAGEFAFRFGNTGVEDQLAERMMQDPPTAWFSGVRPVATMLASATQELFSDDHRQMLAELLGVGVSDHLAIEAGPLTHSLAATASQVAISSGAPEAARSALRQAVGSGSHFLFNSLGADELVRRIVDEQFIEASHRRDRLWCRKASDE